MRRCGDLDTAYQKDLSHITWAEVFERQRQRAELVEQWLDDLLLNQGDAVLDIGCGPGYVSLQAAERVGKTGRVYAVDTSAQALAHLERLKQERGLPQITSIAADARTMDEVAGTVRAVLVTMMLHHADDPAGLIGNVARLLPAGTRAVVAEFHPEGPCLTGPPREHRVSPEQVQAWCTAAGFTVLTYRRQSPEHYMFLLHRDGGT